MCLDQTWHDETAAGVEGFAVSGEIGLNRRDPALVYADVRSDMLASQ